MFAILCLTTVAVYSFVKPGSVQAGTPNIRASNATTPSFLAPNATTLNIAASNATSPYVNAGMKFKDCISAINFANQLKKVEIDAKLTLKEPNMYVRLYLAVNGVWVHTETHLCSTLNCNLKIFYKTPGRNMAVQFMPAERIRSCEWTLNEFL